MTDQRTKPWRVTDKCACGHQRIAHSPVYGCVFCECDKTHPTPPEIAKAAENR